MFDAIYSARLDPFKRHELAQGIDRLLLAYGYAVLRSQSAAYEQVRNILPKAFFANHHFSSDGRSLEADEICRLYKHSQVGLCLSAVEGCMRASMEYLLAGLPVVSTPSIGGRERYYTAPYCQVVEATPEAVAMAVHDLGARNLDRQKIRDHVIQMVAFDRYNFLMNVNKITKLHLGRDDLIPSMAPMIGAIAKFFLTSNVVPAIKKEFASLHRQSA
jgi:glycosyltransferase involved in cell wall biosynthesis